MNNIKQNRPFEQQNKFETPYDIHGYLLSGGTIVNIYDRETIIKYVGYVLKNCKTGEINKDLFINPSEWEPYISSNWYDDIPPNGLWCSYEGKLMLINECENGKLLFNGEFINPMLVKPITREFYEDMWGHIYEY